MQKICVLAILSFVLFSGTAQAGDVLFETTLPWYYSWSTIHWGSGSLTRTNQIAIRYTPTSNQEVCTIKPGLFKSGNPTDGIVLTVRGGGNGYPTGGTVMGTVTVPASQVSSPPILPQQSAYTTFTFSPCLNLTANTNYSFVFNRTQLPNMDTPDLTNWYVLQMTNLIYYPQTAVWGYAPVNGFWNESVNYEPALRIEGSDKEPVLIIPGIAGSELYNGDDLIWADLKEMIWNPNDPLDFGDHFLTDNLMLDENGNSLQPIVASKAIEQLPDVPIIDAGAFNVDTFKSLREDLESSQYSLNNNLFYFPYDWRLNLDSTKDLLNARMEEIKSQTGAQKVNIIAHSMGGLLVKNYMSSYGNNSIGNLIFVGTPHLGAPKAGKVLLAGDNMGIPWLEEDRLKELAGNYPALHQLLPNQRYFDTFLGYIQKYGTDTFLNHQDTRDFITDKNSSSLMMALAENFWSKNLENIDFSGVNVYNFSGCSSSTQAGYRLKSDNTSIGSIGYISGDSTVPLVSSDYINISEDNKFYLQKAYHSEMPSQEDIRQAILDILSGNPITLAGNLKSDSTECNFTGKTLTWHSPVEVHIYDSQGRHSGPIENEGIENSISGVDYQIIDHDKFIFLPTDTGETYNIVAGGLATGSFDLLISQNNNGVIENTTVFNDVPIGESGEVNFNVSDSSSDSSINVDYYGNDVIQNIQANSILSGNEGFDLVAPETQAIITGQAGNEGWYLGNVNISLSAIDDNSGVLETRYSLDGQPLAVYSGSINVSDEGLHTILYYSVDKAGNNEEVKSLSFGIDMTSLEISVIFDTETESFKFSPISDEPENINFSCDSISYTAIDLAGNITRLEFNLTREGRNQILILSAINYNGTNYLISSKKFIVKLWEQKEEFRDFDQGFWVNNERELHIDYKEKQDQSLILHKLTNQKPTRETIGGKRFLQVLTNKGNIEYIIL